MGLSYDKIRNIEDAFHYLTECCLATVEALASKKGKYKPGYKRHKGIAQKAMDQFSIHCSAPPLGRAKEVAEDFHGNIEKWAKSIENEVYQTKEGSLTLTNAQLAGQELVAVYDANDFYEGKAYIRKIIKGNKDGVFAEVQFQGESIYCNRWVLPVDQKW